MVKNQALRYLKINNAALFTICNLNFYMAL